MTWPIVTMPIETEADVVAVRQRARHLAALLSFERQDQTRIATAVSEIARNAFSYAGGGRVEFAIEEGCSPQMFTVRISDQGQGIADIDAILDGRFRSPHGMGLGLVGAKRLMDRFRATSRPGQGTVIELGHNFPPRAGRVTRAKVSEITSALAPVYSQDPLAILREQNRELMQSLEELRRRQDESAQLSRELGDTNRGVVALYAELDERAEQLRQASELKSRFLSNISHEFRTPLNSILALSRLLLDRLDGGLTVEQERQVGYIRRSAESLLDLVNDLLDLAKVEAGKVDIKPGPFTVNELFGGLRGALKPLQTNEAVELSFDAEPGMPELFTDEAKVAQILRNLISNALKFTEKGEVRVAASHDADKDCATFSVRDTGIGIAPEDQPRIFEEFAQVETRLHKKIQGTGLGLPLSRSLAELLGGKIEVESVVGQGSVFRLVIPAAVGEGRRSDAPGMDSERKRILVIDDDETYRYVIRQLIGSEARYEVIEAGNGEDGLRLARESTPACIMLDLQMPHVDGFAVLQQLESEARTKAIPVIIATSLAVTMELKSRLPAGVRIFSKEGMSRESVSLALKDATGR